MEKEKDLAIVPRETNEVIVANKMTNIALAKMNAIEAFAEEAIKTMKVGIDYGTIKGTGKPTLLKPGAEKILLSLGISPRYELEDKIEIFDEGREFAKYSYKCILTLQNQDNNNEPIIITEGVGMAHTKEKNVGTANPLDVFNTKQKIAKKRAMIDATLGISGLSSHFTQDIADDTIIGGESAKPDKFAVMGIYSKVYKALFESKPTESQKEKCKVWLNELVADFMFNEEQPIKTLFDKKMTLGLLKRFEEEVLEVELPKHEFDKKNSKIKKKKGAK